CATEEDGSLTLHYHSSRSGYHPLVKGLLCAVAREIFNQKINIETISCASEEIEAGSDQVHVIFHVTIPDQPESRLQADTTALQKVCRPRRVSPVEDIDNELTPVTLSKEQLSFAFPYHLIFDQKLRLRQFGQTIARLSPVELREGMQISSAFHILYPRISFNVQNICRFINAIFIIAVGPEAAEYDEHGFSMKGQMMWMTDTKLMIFIGSPRLMSLKEMKRLNMYMADIPLYDVTREMVLLYQQRNAEIDITKKLDETTAELTRTSRALALEKQRTEKLLYQMLPEKVANQLRNGEEVEAEKFDQVTVLFSDIVNFTEIAAACSPLDVVSMLNGLYHRFDLKSNEHGVYKVETIGDAYMVVSGVPDITDKHAQLVANFAMDMINQAAYVLSPDTGQPLQIRVGTHSGPVVAGVVGVKMPRYCLFGDTVNTASRMESHAVPGRIHISTETFELIRGHGYICRDRGEVNVKGKGVMRTYFLIGREDKMMPEPNDEHCALPFARDRSNVSRNPLGRAIASLQNGYARELPNTIPSNNKHTSVLGNNEPGKCVDTTTQKSIKDGVCPNIQFTNSSNIGVRDNDSKKNNECKNKVYIVKEKPQDIINNHSSKVESAQFKETSRSPERTPPSRKLIKNTSRVSSTDLDSGVSFADQLTFQDNASNLPDIAWKDPGNLIKFSEQPGYVNHLIRGGRGGDMGRLPLHSKTCVLL
ncbi:unnamed protein product, partial [Candidula unifasciata]